MDGPFDVIVIGAGINGAGIARDAAMRGLRVLLVDKHDVANATTSRSTRLIHGGLRYLEHYEFSLVREALRERQIQLDIAPHLVRPLSFLLPIYEGFRRGPAMIRMGMVAYDALSGRKSVGRHEMFTSEEALEREPGIDEEGLRAAAVYYDAQAEFPERLAVEAVVDARACGAVVRLYTEVTAIAAEEGRVRSVTCRDVLGGDEWTAGAPVVVNASGPWVDDVLARADGEFARHSGGTKGSHLVVEPFEGAPGEALYVEAEDERPFFIIPWLGRYLIGTTDLPFDGDLDEIAATDEEIDYLIDSTNRVIPGADLTRDHLLYSYAGQRPLPYEPDADPGEITRSHIVERHDQVEGLISIIGGKITTWRALAEDTVDAVFAFLDRDDPGCSTGDVALPGGRIEDWDGFARDVRRSSRLPATILERLLSVYGARVREIEALAEEDGLGEPLGDTDLLGAEVVFAFQEELAVTIADVLLRRSMIGYGPDLGRSAVEPAAQLAAARLGWSEERVQHEVERYERELRRFRPEARSGDRRAVVR